MVQYAGRVCLNKRLHALADKREHRPLHGLLQVDGTDTYCAHERHPAVLALLHVGQTTTSNLSESTRALARSLDCESLIRICRLQLHLCRLRGIRWQLRTSPDKLPLPWPASPTRVRVGVSKLTKRVGS